MIAEEVVIEKKRRSQAIEHTNKMSSGSTPLQGGKQVKKKEGGTCKLLSSCAQGKGSVKTRALIENGYQVSLVCTEILPKYI